jgi:hypothetical protein
MTQFVNPTINRKMILENKSSRVSDSIKQCDQSVPENAESSIRRLLDGLKIDLMDEFEN